MMMVNSNDLIAIKDETVYLDTNSVDFDDFRSWLGIGGKGLRNVKFTFSFTDMKGNSREAAFNVRPAYTIIDPYSQGVFLPNERAALENMKDMFQVTGGTIYERSRTMFGNGVFGHTTSGEEIFDYYKIKGSFADYITKMGYVNLYDFFDASDPVEIVNPFPGDVILLEDIHEKKSLYYPEGHVTIMLFNNQGIDFLATVGDTISPGEVFATKTGVIEDTDYTENTHIVSIEYQVKVGKNFTLVLGSKKSPDMLMSLLEVSLTKEEETLIKDNYNAIYLMLLTRLRHPQTEYTLMLDENNSPKYEPPPNYYRVPKYYSFNKKTAEEFYRLLAHSMAGQVNKLFPNLTKSWIGGDYLATLTKYLDSNQYGLPWKPDESLTEILTPRQQEEIKDAANALLPYLDAVWAYYFDHLNFLSLSENWNNLSEKEHWDNISLETILLHQLRKWYPALENESDQTILLNAKRIIKHTGSNDCFPKPAEQCELPEFIETCPSDEVGSNCQGGKLLFLNREKNGGLIISEK